MSIITPMNLLSLCTGRFYWRPEKEWHEIDIEYYLLTRNFFQTSQFFTNPACYRGKFNIKSTVKERWVLADLQTMEIGCVGEFQVFEKTISTGYLVFSRTNFCLYEKNLILDAFLLLVSATFKLSNIDLLYVALPENWNNFLIQNDLFSSNQKEIYSPQLLDAFILSKKRTNEPLCKIFLTEISKTSWEKMSRRKYSDKLDVVKNK